MTNEDWITIAGFDPGKVTGMAEGVFSENEPLAILDVAAVTYENLRDGFPYLLEGGQDIWVAEEFTARTDNEFVPDLTGVRVEGLLDLARTVSGAGTPIIWRPRTKKEQVPDSILKEHGLWKTGEDVGWEDGRDVNDAIIHILGYVAFDLGHRPTLRKYFR